MKMWLFAGVLTSVLVFAGCASGGSSGGSVAGGASGSGTASAHGFGGNITVTVTVEKGKITEVLADGPHETAGLGSTALISLPAQMVQRNSVEVNAVSGSTITSNAIIEAAKAAVDQIK